jgi:hypothetical protein
LVAGSFTKAPRTWLTQEVFLPKGDIFFPLKARYDQARISLPPLLVPPVLDSVSLLLPGMQPVDSEPLIPSEPLDLNPDPLVLADPLIVTAEDAQGACPHYPIPPPELREVE